MYASQTKRLCVREAPSDEIRVQQPSNSSAEATTETVNLQQNTQSTLTSSTSTSSSFDNNLVTISASSKASVKSYITDNLAASEAAAVPGLINLMSNRSPLLSNMTASATGATSAGTGDENRSPNKTSTKSKISPVIHQTNINNNRSTVERRGNDIRVGLEYLNGHYNEQELIDRLASATLEETKLELILAIRNLITACNKKKDSLVRNPNFSKILHIIDTNEESSPVVKAQFALLLCSIAKGGEANVKTLNQSLVDDRILNLVLNSRDEFLTEACLRCLRAIMSWPQGPRKWLIYDRCNLSSDKPKQDSSLSTESNEAQIIIGYAKSTNSFTIQECISDIFASTCNRSKDQIHLLKCGSLSCIAQLIESNSNRVIVSALNWLIAICMKNATVSREATQVFCPSGNSLINRLIDLMKKDNEYDMQFLSAKCFAHIYRALNTEEMEHELKIASHVLPTLILMVKADKPAKLRAESAECIAYLIENDKRLQETASICDHLIESLTKMLEQDSSSVHDLKSHHNQSQLRNSSSNNRHLNERDQVLTAVGNGYRHQVSPPILDLRSSRQSDQIDEYKSNTDFTENTISISSSSEYTQEMKRASFLALAALASTLEPIRKKIFDSCTVMQHLVSSLSDEDPKTVKAVLACLLSLSRSVQQLRTNFAENSIYSALKDLLHTKSTDILILVLAVLCNVSLDFSPGKQQFLDSATIASLSSLTRGPDQHLKLHAMWILMNMVYQLKDQNLKFQILRALGPEYVFNILESEEHEELVLKTLGFLRNLLSQKPHIDAIMSSYGEQIMQSLVRVLERPCSSKIKEQAMCVLTNIADGIDSKIQIMSNRVVLSYLASTICDERAGDIRLAAICCITNLAHKKQEGSYERRDEMRKFGIEDRLKSLLNTSDPIISDRVRTAYNQFCRSIDDKCVG